LLDFGIGGEGRGWVIIRSGPLGAYVKSRETTGAWVDAYWTAAESDKVVDVTGEAEFGSSVRLPLLIIQPKVQEIAF